MFNRLHLFVLLVAMLLASGCHGNLLYESLSQQEPRPQQIHVLRFDLQSNELMLGVSVSDDPDGDGPAETVLTTPLAHMRRAGFLAAVNANAWGMVPPPPQGTRPLYIAGRAADILGFARTDDRLASPVQRNYWSFWLDDDGVPFIGNIAEEPPRTRLAVAGFGGLLQAGKILPRADETRHPRTAIGIDRDKRWLILVVVDGRQPGYSEGMSTHELATLMQELGAWDALNLDGGGSSIMLRRLDNGEPYIVNRPSGIFPRPLPVMIGIQPRP